MLNQSQVSLEALYSAAYVEDYLDSMENLPHDLQRQLTRIRHLDVAYGARFRDVSARLRACAAAAHDRARRARAVARVHRDLLAAQELGDEKLLVLQQLQDVIYERARRLDVDRKNLVAHLDRGDDDDDDEGDAAAATPAAGAASVERNDDDASPNRNDASSSSPPRDEAAAAASSKQGKEASSAKDKAKRNSRRARDDDEEPVDKVDRDKDRDKDGSSKEGARKGGKAQTGRGGAGGSGAGGGAQGKKKKRKRQETPPPDDQDAIDPDEPTYCLCVQISYGEMILCDNDLCPIEWFHFSCVSLATKPKGKWFCPMCRGDRPNVMKPKGQFLKDLEKYNKEKEENN